MEILSLVDIPQGPFTGLMNYLNNSDQIILSTVSKSIRTLCIKSIPENITFAECCQKGYYLGIVHKYSQLNLIDSNDISQGFLYVTEMGNYPIISFIVLNQELSQNLLDHGLYMSSCNNHVKIAKFLFLKGATMLCEDLAYVILNICRKGHKESFEFVFHSYQNAKLNFQWNQCLCEASKFGQLEIIESIVELFDKYKPQNDGVTLHISTAFRRACENNQLDTVKYFLENHETKLSGTDTTFRYVCSMGLCEVVSLLLPYVSDRGMAMALAYATPDVAHMLLAKQRDDLINCAIKTSDIKLSDRPQRDDLINCAIKTSDIKFSDRPQIFLNNNN